MMNKKELELYVHIPFCISKCDYCDFLSSPQNEMVQKGYVEKLIEEIQVQSAGYEQYQVETIFIGGGTPSILKTEWIELLLEVLFHHFDIGKQAEITIEANPGTVTLEKLNTYRKMGINRLSLGLQSADNQELKVLGRIHTYESFLKSYEYARAAGFTNINVDLMSALPKQTPSSWKNTLKKVLMLKPDHISAYSLIIEEGTPFYQNSDNLQLPDEESEREMYYLTKSYLQAHGYERYEISNYAKPGLECRHNIGYWTGIEYLGLGLGASSYITGCRFHNEQNLNRYLARKVDDPDYTNQLCQEVEVLSLQARMEEFMFLGLRLMKGISEIEFAGRFGHSIWDIYGEAINHLLKEELLEERETNIRLTDRGIDISNYVMARFLTDS